MRSGILQDDALTMKRITWLHDSLQNVYGHAIPSSEFHEALQDQAYSSNFNGLSILSQSPISLQTMIEFP